MRPRIFVAMVIAFVVVAGFVLSSGRPDQGQLAQQSTEPVAEAAPAHSGALAEVIAREDRALARKAAEEARALTSDERHLAQKIAHDERALARKAALEQAALRDNGRARQQDRMAATTQAVPAAADAPLAASDGDGVAARSDAGTTSGAATAMDEQDTSGAIVEGSTTSAADDPETAAGSADQADPADTAGAAPMPEGDAADGTMESAGNGQADIDVTGGAAGTADLEHLLKLENFDHDAVVALIDDAEDLSTGKRLALRALAEGATAATSMAETAIGSMREALDLPPVN